MKAAKVNVGKGDTSTVPDTALDKYAVLADENLVCGDVDTVDVILSRTSMVSTVSKVETVGVAL